ncbi:MAG: protein phosphatase 2C domain-containing protein [Clostridia bacterium]|nr:protein phosphatase 2C domain-containing protein [Clostridia bacterium]
MRKRDMNGLQAFAYNVIGGKHIKAGKPCQDAARAESRDGISVIAVADGHGASEHYLSDVGASLAVDIAMVYIRQFAKQIGKEELTQENFRRLKKAILARWREEVMKDFRKRRENLNVRDGDDPIRAYGTTLIAAAVTKEFWLALQIGDGNCIEWYDGLQFSESMPRDPYCTGESTSSLCQKDALERFRFCFGFRIPTMLLLHTDGIDDSMMDDAQRCGCYLSFAAGFREGIENGLSSLRENLGRIAVLWKKDDVSAAGVIQRETIVSCAETLYPIYIKQKKEREYQRLMQKISETEAICHAMEKDIDSFRSRREYDRNEKLLREKEALLVSYRIELEEDRKSLERYKNTETLC